MGQENRFVVIDTDILIKIFRGDEAKRKIVKSLDEFSAVSIVTAMELYVGAKSSKKLFDLGKRLKTVKIFELTPKISLSAYKLVKKYNLKHQLLPADALIAATAIENKLPLYTDNLSDYSFIEELQLFRPK
jgi:hypothetical protein